MKIAAVLVAWAFMGLGSLGAFIAFPIAWFMDETDYAKNAIRALDKTAAAFLGFSGKFTVSAECGRVDSGWPSDLGKIIDAMLGAGHCDAAARREGIA